MQKAQHSLLNTQKWDLSHNPGIHEYMIHPRRGRLDALQLGKPSSLCIEIVWDNNYTWKHVTLSNSARDGSWYHSSTAGWVQLSSSCIVSKFSKQLHWSSFHLFFFFPLWGTALKNKSNEPWHGQLMYFTLQHPHLYPATELPVTPHEHFKI
jgi:hypothetical protein